MTVALAIAAFVAGVTGTWSPCGFSMIETIGPTGHGGGRRTTLAGCATFAVGALAGGVITYGSLSLAGAALEGGPATLVAALVAAAAAIGEARGVRIVPQVRRQVPEHWRRVLPLPVAAGLYGVLLGLGFTTFVLTLAVWALAGMTLALGDPGLGLAVGLAFGAGRLLPVVALAPFAGSPVGDGACATMAERPSLLRGLRMADAAALGACALVLAAAPASAAVRVAATGSDPSVSGDTLAYDRQDAGVLQRGTTVTTLPGTDPAVGGALVAWLSAGQVTVANAASLAPAFTIAAAGVDAVAVSDSWIVWRTRRGDGSDRLSAARIADPSRVAYVAATKAPAQLGRPYLDGERVVFGVAASRGRSRIVEVNLATGKPRTLRRGRAGVLVSNPSLRSGRLLFVRTSSRTQQLLLGPAGRRGRDRMLYEIAGTARRDSGVEHGHKPLRRHYHEPHPPPRQRGESSVTLWTTALSARAAYVTRLRSAGGTTKASVVRVRRP